MNDLNAERLIVLRHFLDAGHELAEAVRLTNSYFAHPLREVRSERESARGDSLSKVVTAINDSLLPRNASR